MELRKTFRFEASHILPKHPGKCSRLHGHSWVLHVFVNGKVNKETGFVMDYADISAAVKPLIENLDHKHLGQWLTDDNKMPIGMSEDCSCASWTVPEMKLRFYPSSENLLIWIGQQLNTLPWHKLALEETCTSYCELTRIEFNETHSQEENYEMKQDLRY